MSIDPDEIDTEAIDEAAQEVDEDVTTRGKWWARAVLTFVVLAGTTLVVWTYYNGVGSGQFAPSASPDVTGPVMVVAWAAGIGAASFILGLIVMALPGSVIGFFTDVLDGYNKD